MVDLLFVGGTYGLRVFPILIKFWKLLPAVKRLVLPPNLALLFILRFLSIIWSLDRCNPSIALLYNFVSITYRTENNPPMRF
jgi:hypothetical protein